MATPDDLRIEPRRRPVGTGAVDRLLPHHTRRMVGPFIFADVIGPEVLPAGAGTDIDAHPHIGLSTVTYLFAGRMVHRDSTGAVQTIEPGAVNWMTAGSGVTHTERSHPDDVPVDRPLHGLQTWVALPDDTQETAPSFEHVAVADVPTDTIGASTVRVAAGTGWGLTSPVAGSSPLVLAEVHLRDQRPVPIATGHPELAVVALDDHVTVDGEPLPRHHLVVLDTSHGRTLDGAGRAVVLGGDPVGPRHIWWNFVHADADRIELAKADWTAQRFPLVPGDHDPWVPLPTASS